MIASICASQANGPSGRATVSTRTPISASMVAIYGRAVSRFGWKPVENLQTYLVWEHFSEDDDRMRTSKQLCNTDPVPTEIGGVPVASTMLRCRRITRQRITSVRAVCRVRCIRAMLSRFRTASRWHITNLSERKLHPFRFLIWQFDPYASTTQSRNLRVIETSLNPEYKAKNDTVEFNADYKIAPALTFTRRPAYNNDFLWSTEDYNRFDTAEGAFQYTTPKPGPAGTNEGENNLHVLTPDPNGLGHCSQTYGECSGSRRGPASRRRRVYQYERARMPSGRRVL